MSRCRGLSLAVVLVVLPFARAAEVPVADVAEGGAALSQYPDSGASDGTDYLFTWTDGHYNQRRATRVTGDGVVLDRSGILLPDVTDRNSVVWTGTSYLVVWGTSHPSTTWALRIDRDGRILGGPQMLRRDAYPVAVATSGSHVVIGYHGFADPYGEIRRGALVLTPDGELVSDMTLDEPVTSGGMMTIAWNGTHFAAVWVHTVLDDPRYAVKGIRFNAAGPLDEEPRELLQGTSTHAIRVPAIASDGEGFVLITSTGNGRETARSLSADLSSVGAPHLLPELDYELLPPLNYSSPLVWTGSSFVIAGHDDAFITIVRLDREGRTIDTETIESAARSTDLNPVMATNGDGLLVAWSGRALSGSPEPDTDVFGTFVAASTLDRRSRTLLSVGAQHQVRPLIAFGGTNLLAVWREGSGVYARRMTQEGASLDAAPVRLTESGAPAAVTFNGQDYIVAWEEPTSQPFVMDVVTARVPRDGVLRFTHGTRLQKARARALASNGTVTLLLWDSDDGLEASRLRADGSLLDILPLRITDLGPSGRVAMAPGDDDFLVVWEEFGEPPFFMTPPLLSVKVRGARISPDLVNRDVGGFDIAANTPFEDEPSVTWDGHKWLVVWTSEGGPSPGGTSIPEAIRGRHVAQDGTLDGDAAGTMIIANARKATLAWDGTRYFLTWQDRTGGDLVRAAWLPRLGSPVVGETALTPGYRDVSLAPFDPGRVGAAYARTVVEPVFGEVSRAFVNFVGLATKRRAMR